MKSMNIVKPKRIIIIMNKSLWNVTKSLFKIITTNFEQVNTELIERKCCLVWEGRITDDYRDGKPNIRIINIGRNKVQESYLENL